jgi:hypothetical protein
VLDGNVIERNRQRHRHEEFINSLNKINRETPAEKSIHLILDKYDSHKPPKSSRVARPPPAFTFYFVPTSCS